MQTTTTTMATMTIKSESRTTVHEGHCTNEPSTKKSQKSSPLSPKLSSSSSSSSSSCSSSSSSSFPPSHMLALTVSILALSVCNLPSWEEIDEIATFETFSRPARADSIFARPSVLGGTRLAFATLIFGVTRWIMLNEDWMETMHYHPDSKLRSHPVRFYGIKTQFWFTKMSWNLLGVSFLLSGAIPLLPRSFVVERPWLSRAALVSYEVAAPVAILVSLIVTYVLWPEQLRTKGKGVSTFGCVTNLLQHNANAVAVLLESLVVGDLPVSTEHVSVALLYGVSYVFFGWFMRDRWISFSSSSSSKANDEKGSTTSQFLYFFLDTTLGIKSSLFLFLLLVALLFSYLMFSVGRDWLLASVEPENDSISWRLSCVLCLAYLVCKVRD